MADFSVEGPPGDGDIEDLAAAFVIPPTEGPEAPMTYHTKLLPLGDFETIREHEAVIAYMMRKDEKVKAGKRILGTCHMPKVQGDLSPLFDWMLDRTLGYFPDYLIVLDQQWWDLVNVRQREILVFHELKHCCQKTNRNGEPLFERESGRPIWGIIGHDVEEFTSTVQRYGAWNAELAEFIGAAKEGFKF